MSFTPLFFSENWFLIPFLRGRQPHDVCHCQAENIVISQIIFYFIKKNLYTDMEQSQNTAVE